MKPYFETDTGKIYCGHVLDILQQFEDESIDCIMTSPPYWALRDYGGGGLGFQGHSGYYDSEGNYIGTPGKRNKRCVWDIPTVSFSEAHFAVYPEELCETPLIAGCPQEGTVLDPFMGAGTTLLKAEKLDLKWIGIDIVKDYCEMSKNRLGPELAQHKIDFEACK